MPPRAAAPNWDAVMTGLTGLHLAIYDELLRDGAMDAATLGRLVGDSTGTAETMARLTTAIAWLENYRLLVAQDGTWRAVGLGLARMNYESNGPTTTPSAVEGPRTKEQGPRAENTPNTRGATAAVQRHQREFFTLEGYKDSLGTL